MFSILFWLIVGLLFGVALSMTAFFVTLAFTDVSKLPYSHPDRVQYMARCYGSFGVLF
jgi:hypothetical protein